MKKIILSSSLILFFMITCTPQKEKNIPELSVVQEKVDTDSLQHSLTSSMSKAKENEKDTVYENQDHFICYAEDTDSNLAISICFDSNSKALHVKYKGQKEVLQLSFIKEEYLEGGAHPTLESY